MALSVRTAESVTVHLPQGLDLATVMPKSLVYRHDDARWLVSTVFYKEAFGDVDPHGFARLHSEVLDRVMAKVTRPAVIRSLVAGGVLEIAGHSKGVRSRGYRLTAEYRTRPIVAVRLRDPRLIDRILRERARMEDEQKTRWVAVDYELDAVQRERLTVTPEADVIVAGLVPKVRWVQEFLIHRIRQRWPNYTISTTGRRFNAVTGLKRALRSSLRLDGEPIGGVDIKTTQPALLAAMIDGDINVHQFVATYTQGAPGGAPSPAGRRGRRSNARGLSADCASVSRLLTACRLPSAPPVGADFASFRQSVFEGRLYDDLVDVCSARGVCLNGPDGPRDRVKVLVLQEILAKRGRYRSDFERVFTELFPSVVRMVRWFNRDDHCALIRALQRLEAWLVVETVAPRLVERIPIVTLHDAIFSRDRDLALVSDAFQETFDRLGFPLTVKTEVPNGGQ
jgi:hypothetical protein